MLRGGQEFDLSEKLERGHCRWSTVSEGVWHARGQVRPRSALLAAVILGWNTVTPSCWLLPVRTHLTCLCLVFDIYTPALVTGHGKDDCTIKTSVSQFPINPPRLSMWGELSRMEELCPQRGDHFTPEDMSCRGTQVALVPVLTFCLSTIIPRSLHFLWQPTQHLTFTMQISINLSRILGQPVFVPINLWLALHYSNKKNSIS